MSLRHNLRIAAALAALMVQPLLGNATIRGRIHDPGGRPLKSATITAKSAPPAYSNDGGEFTIQLPASSGSVDLLFEAPGYYPETLRYEIAAQADLLDVVLTARRIVKEEIRVIGSRLDVSLASTPAAATVVGQDTLNAMARSIAIDEALKIVPGVKVDNQANGERVHLSIRGQGILSERGIRGVQVLYDGLPLNDPSGFCPDVYDIDWAGVQEVNVVRGPVAFLYGGGSAGGVIDIRTRTPESGLVHGGVWTAGGSNSFYKMRGEVSGTGRGLSYLISGSRTAGDGYREHTAFWGDNLYGRFSFNPLSTLRLTAFGAGTGFFNENAEGLNLSWGWPGASWWTMANPDALSFNEYQRTDRVTSGFSGQWQAARNQRVSINFYTRKTAYTEPVPSSVERRHTVAPGGSVQYDTDSGRGRIRNRFSAGLDLDGQFVDDLRHPNLGQAVEGPELLANQSITQKRIGGYFTNKIGLGQRWSALLGLRFDRIGNLLTDSLRLGGLDLSGSRYFTRATGRVGATYAASEDFTLFASWGQGFLPPATEELYANPAALGGFNMRLAPATSVGEEFGVRGAHGNRIFWETEVFRLDTRKDFERYRIVSRPLETFYGNAGESRRYGVETGLRWLPFRRLALNGAYTYSHFLYTKYESLTYSGVITGNRLPNSPSHQAFVRAACEFLPGWTLTASADAYSRAFIDPTNRTWIDGYALLNAQVSKTWQRRRAFATFFVAGKNLTGKRYIAFTEPDPDGNSYQPGSNREVLTGFQIRF